MYLLLVSHGNLASGIITSYEMIAGSSKCLDYIELDNSGVAIFRKKLAKYFENKTNVLVLADMKGGTPYNEVLKIFLGNSQKIQLISGLNLSMLLEVGTQMTGNSNIYELARLAEVTGKDSVEIATDTDDSADSIEF